VEGGTSASSVAIQPDGKILVVTSHSQHPWLSGSSPAPSGTQRHSASTGVHELPRQDPQQFYSAQFRRARRIRSRSAWKALIS